MASKPDKEQSNKELLEEETSDPAQEAPEGETEEKPEAVPEVTELSDTAESEPSEEEKVNLTKEPEEASASELSEAEEIEAMLARKPSPANAQHTPKKTAAKKPAPKKKPKKHTKKKKKRRGHTSLRVYGVLIMLTIIFVVSITLSVGIIEVGKDMLGIDGTETLIIFNIPEGATTVEIAEDLEAAGIIRIPKAFVYFTRLSQNDANFIAGDHEISSSMAYETIISELTGTAVQDDRANVNVMFPEGITLQEAAKKLEEANVCDAARFLYFFNAGNLGYDFENYLPTGSSKLKFNRMEGYLFPDTYNFYEEMEPDDVCRKIYVNFNSKITDEYYERMDELGMSLDEIITLASMIQAEAADESEMKDISSVFWNRLNNSREYPLLQSDPTSKYVEEVIKPNIELKDQVIFDAYDTYICTGLPAGAIGNPGAAAIEAALYPNDTDYFYFYANVETGITYFARTLDEHNDNIDMVKQMQAGTWDPDAQNDDNEDGEDGEDDDAEGADW